jgi:hypothetical protein
MQSPPLSHGTAGHGIGIGIGILPTPTTDRRTTHNQPTPSTHHSRAYQPPTHTCPHAPRASAYYTHPNRSATRRLPAAARRGRARRRTPKPGCDQAVQELRHLPGDFNPPTPPPGRKSIYVLMQSERPPETRSTPTAAADPATGPWVCGTEAVPRCWPSSGENHTPAVFPDTLNAVWRSLAAVRLYLPRGRTRQRCPDCWTASHRWLSVPSQRSCHPSGRTRPCLDCPTACHRWS